jgi:hypothetical protein
MTLVTPETGELLTPATHALVIGVGRYSYLEGGTGRVVPHTHGLKQLTSSTVSAVAFADYLHELKNPRAPLGSIELLLSPDAIYVSPKTGKRTAVETATWDNIARAYDRWFDRCDTNSKNVAIFYFAGHGLENVTLALLPEDFGLFRKKPFHTAIHFNQTYLAMNSCRAATQCYFLDCCRQQDAKILANPKFGGEPLGEPDLRDQRSLTAPILYATGIGRQAFGNEHEVSRFTSALLSALRGGGATKEQARWVISTESLGTAVIKLIEQQNRGLHASKHQSASLEGKFSSPYIMHELSATPDVAAVVDCSPQNANAAAELFVGELYRRARGDAGPLRRPIKAGTYDVGALFQTGAGFKDILWEDEWIEPPIYEVCLEAK